MSSRCAKEGLTRYVRWCQEMLECYVDMPRYANACQGVLMRVRVCQCVSGCENVCQGVLGSAT